MGKVMNEMTRKSVDLYISKIYGDEPQFNEYIKANAAERAKMRSTKYLELPFFSTKFIRKFIQLFAEDFSSSIKNGTRNLAYAYAKSYELFQDFRHLFIEVFGSSLDFSDESTHDHKTYLQVRKRIGTEARDYWYEEVEALIPGLRSSLPYPLPCEPKKINDTFFDNKLFEDASNYDQKALTRRLDDWRDVTQRKYIPDLYEGLNTLKTDCEYKDIDSDTDSDDEFIKFNKNFAKNYVKNYWLTHPDDRDCFFA